MFLLLQMLQQHFPKSGKSERIIFAFGVIGIELPNQLFSIVQPDPHGGGRRLQGTKGWNTVDVAKKHPTVVFGSKPFAVNRDDITASGCFVKLP